MASFRQRSGRWQAQIRRHGECISETFDTKAQAKVWARRIESDLDHGKAIGKAKVRGTVRELLDAYEVAARKIKPLGRSKLGVLKHLREGLGSKSLRKLSADDILEHARKRREGRLIHGQIVGAGPVTIALDLALLGTVLRASHGLLGVPLSVEPVRQAREALKAARLAGKSQERDRRPTQGEIDWLCEHFASNPRQKVPMPTLIKFAIATAMRREEITRLRWEDLNEKAGTIVVRDRKDPQRKIGNDETVPLLAVTGYDALAIILSQPRKGDLIFPWKAETITTIFARACDKDHLNIDDLRFHDLRHEGISRMFEAGMEVPEVALCSGHKDWRTLRRYTQLKAATVASRYRPPPEPAATGEPPDDDTESTPP